MGLFDFWKDKGDDVIKDSSTAADEIKSHVEKNADVKDLKVAFDDGVVELSGTAPDTETRETAVISAGNVKGVSEVKADGLAPPETTPDVDFYTIESGDTLSAIAKKYYGDASKYPKIFEANRGIISDPDKIYPGQKIRIPRN